MSDQQTDSRALRNKGLPITLLDGRVANLSFDLESLAEIEEQFGSLGALQDLLGEVEDGGEEMNSKFFGPMLKFLRCGLIYEPSFADARFDLATIGDDFMQCMRAFYLAFPKVKPGATDTQTTTPAQNIESFLGNPSITSQPSSTEEATPNSGE